MFSHCVSLTDLPKLKNVWHKEIKYDFCSLGWFCFAIQAGVWKTLTYAGKLLSDGTTSVGPKSWVETISHISAGSSKTHRSDCFTTCIIPQLLFDCGFSFGSIFLHTPKVSEVTVFRRSRFDTFQPGTSQISLKITLSFLLPTFSLKTAPALLSWLNDMSVRRLCCFAAWSEQPVIAHSQKFIQQF